MDWQNWTLPAWATTDEAKAFVYGFFVAASVAIWKAAARWVKRSLDDRETEG